MKKRFSRSLISMVLCLAMVVGICVVPASASAREEPNTSKVWVDGTEIWVRTFDSGPEGFSGELVVVGYDPNYEYSGTKVYGPALGSSGENFRPGVYYNPFPISAPSSDYILELRIEFLDSNWGVGKSITVSYDISKDTLTVLQPTSRTIIVDQVKICMEDFGYYDGSFYSKIFVDASNSSSYTNTYYIKAEFSPDLDSVGGTSRPGGAFAVLAPSGRVGEVTNIAFRFTLYDQSYNNLLEIIVSYDVTRNDFIHPPI